jgi:hypothetical protein
MLVVASSSCWCRNTADMCVVIAKSGIWRFLLQSIHFLDLWFLGPIWSY